MQYCLVLHTAAFLSELHWLPVNCHVTHEIISNMKYRVVQKKVDHHAVCEHNLHKLLLNNDFMLVECRCQR